MSVVEGPKAVGLIGRVQNILLKPAAEWDVIEAEPATIQGLYIGYACILAAIPPVASVLGSLLISHWGVMLTIVYGLLQYVLSLVGIFVIAFIVDALAPSFGGQKNQIEAMKLLVYSYTASWVAGVFLIIPTLGSLLAGLGGLYSLYLLFLGLPKLMKSPADKTVIYFLVTLGVSILVYFAIAIVLGIIATMAVVGAAATGAAALGTPN